MSCLISVAGRSSLVLVVEAVGMGMTRNEYYFKDSDFGCWDIVPTSLNYDGVNKNFERWGIVWARFFQVHSPQSFAL